MFGPRFKVRIRKVRSVFRSEFVSDLAVPEAPPRKKLEVRAES